MTDAWEEAASKGSQNLSVFSKICFKKAIFLEHRLENHSLDLNIHRTHSKVPQWKREVSQWCIDPGIDPISAASKTTDEGGFLPSSAKQAFQVRIHELVTGALDSSMMVVNYLAFLLFLPWSYLGWYFSGNKGVNKVCNYHATNCNLNVESDNEQMP